MEAESVFGGAELLSDLGTVV